MNKLQVQDRHFLAGLNVRIVRFCRVFNGAAFVTRSEITQRRGASADAAATVFCAPDAREVM
jgi:hypothetical protein